MEEELILPSINTGLIPEFSEQIWLGDAIPFQVVNESGDWRSFVVAHEKQRDPLETKACVTFSLHNNIEIQHKFKGIDINLSDRFTAKMSNTQQNGNTFERVADSVRKVGVVNEADWSNVPKIELWNEYYKDIPQSVSAKATKIDLNYGVIPRSTDYVGALKQALKQCPLWITVPHPDPNHAITLLHIEGQDKAYVQDHYSYQVKTMSVSKIAYAAKVVINQYLMANQTRVVLSKDGKTVFLATPIAMDFENFKKQAGVEGITVPNPIPPASDL